MANGKPLELPKNVYAYSKDTLTGRKAGDTVWACAFEFNMKKSALGLSQEPVQGILSYTDCEASHELFAKNYGKPGNPYAKCPQYFIPTNSKGTGYLWSKSVNVTSRAYADTYEECSRLYEEMVQNWVDWFERGAALCKEYI